jgi:hypothetical protein
MKHLLTTTGFAALLAAVLTGCGAAGSGAASTPPTTHPAPAADVAITYPISTAMGSRSHATQSCPAGAACTYASIGTTPKGAEIWEPVAHFHLTCSPAGGTYHDPVAACRALLDLQHRMKVRHQICMCPMILTRGAQPRAQGIVDGKPLVLDLSPCSFCGLGKPASADGSVLMPGSG